MHAQNVNEELKKLREKASIANISYQLTFTSYMSDIKSAPMDVNKGKATKKGDFHYNAIQHFEFITTPDCRLIVDHNKKTMYYGKILSFNGGGDPNPQQFSIASLLDFCEASSVKNIDNGTRQLTLTTVEGEINQVDIIYSNVDYSVNRVIYHYAEEMVFLVGEEENRFEGKPLMVVDIDNYITDESKINDYHTINSFLHRSHGNWVLNDAYKNYHLTGNTSTKTN